MKEADRTLMYIRYIGDEILTTILQTCTPTLCPAEFHAGSDCADSSRKKIMFFSFNSSKVVYYLL